MATGPPKMQAPSQHVFSRSLCLNCRFTHMHLVVRVWVHAASLLQKDSESESTSVLGRYQFIMRGFPKYRKTTQKMLNSHEHNTCSALWNLEFQAQTTCISPILSSPVPQVDNDCLQVPELTLQALLSSVCSLTLALQADLGAGEDTRGDVRKCIGLI